MAPAKHPGQEPECYLGAQVANPDRFIVKDNIGYYKPPFDPVSQEYQRFQPSDVAGVRLVDGSVVLLVRNFPIFRTGLFLILHVLLVLLLILPG